MKGAIIIVLLVLAACSTEFDETTEAFPIDVQDKQVCQNITHSSYRDICYSTVAVNIQDNTICENIISESQRGSCITDVSQNIKSRYPRPNNIK